MRIEKFENWKHEILDIYGKFTITKTSAFTRVAHHGQLIYGTCNIKDRRYTVFYEPQASQNELNFTGE